MALQASLTIRSEFAPAAGRERIRLLEAVAREGSITAAAKAVGLTYKAAWDALDALANLFGQPLLETRQGGRAGGGASSPRQDGRWSPPSIGWKPSSSGFCGRWSPAQRRRARAGGCSFRLSHAHELPQRPAWRRDAVKADSLSAAVEVSLPGGASVLSSITRDSVVSLGLCPGRAAVVLIKASFVTIVPADAPALTARETGSPESSPAARSMARAVRWCSTSAAAGRSRPTVTAESIRTLGLGEGVAAFAVVDPSHVILAVD